MTPPTLSTISDRAPAAFGALCCLGVLLVAAWLTPSTDGHGTHTQMSMPECGWVMSFDKPCPTCGMTTAFSHAADGDLLSSAAVQPAGALLAVGASAGFWAFLHSAMFGSRISRVFRPLWTTRWMLAGVGVLVAAWIYKFLTWTS